jgi:AcrR family transcriptional regulator
MSGAKRARPEARGQQRAAREQQRGARGQQRAAPRPRPDARDHIVETAWALARERGVHAVTVADIAAASGVSRQLVYHHFDSRAGLLVAMARHHDAAVGFRRRVVEARSLPPVEALEALLRLWCDYIPDILPVARALEAAVITGDEGGAAWRDRMADIHEAFRLAVERVAEEGRLAPGWTVATAADWIAARNHISTWQHLVVEAGWSPSDYVERTVASILAEVVATK